MWSAAATERSGHDVGGGGRVDMELNEGGRVAVRQISEARPMLIPRPPPMSLHVCVPAACSAKPHSIEGFAGLDAVYRMRTLRYAGAQRHVEGRPPEAAGELGRDLDRFRRRARRLVRTADLELPLHDAGALGELLVVTANILDEPLGVLAAQERLERRAELKSGRERGVDDAVDEHGRSVPRPAPFA